VSLNALGAVQQSEPLLWLIDAAPLVVGAFGWAMERQRRLVTSQQGRIRRLELQRRASVERTAAELSGTALKLLADVSSLGAASAQMTASVRAAIETMTAVSHGATAAALGAETVAGRALEAASKPSLTPEELTATLQSAAAGAKEIARVAQEQTDGVDKVLAAMNQIHFATETATESAHEIAAEARALANRARELRATMGAADLPPGEAPVETPAIPPAAVKAQGGAMAGVLGSLADAAVPRADL
jgi:methyl-accepting chemotaxis protein